MGQCCIDFGLFQNLSTEAADPTEDDYVLHFSLNLLKECCLNEKVPPIIPRMLLNNLAIKISSCELTMQPRHQQWAMEIFDKVRSDLVPDFITKLKIGSLVTPELLLEITNK